MLGGAARGAAYSAGCWTREAVRYPCNRDERYFDDEDVVFFVIFRLIIQPVIWKSRVKCIKKYMGEGNAEYGDA